MYCIMIITRTSSNYQLMMLTRLATRVSRVIKVLLYSVVIKVFFTTYTKLHTDLDTASTYNFGLVPISLSVVFEHLNIS